MNNCPWLERAVAYSNTGRNGYGLFTFPASATNQPIRS